MVYDEADTETGEHLTAAGKPSLYMRRALEMGLEGIPFLNERNRQAIGQYFLFCRQLFKEHPHLGAEYWRWNELPIESRAECKFLLDVWAHYDAFRKEFAWRQEDLKRKTAQGARKR